MPTENALKRQKKQHLSVPERGRLTFNPITSNQPADPESEDDTSIGNRLDKKRSHRDTDEETDEDNAGQKDQSKRDGCGSDDDVTAVVDEADQLYIKASNARAQRRSCIGNSTSGQETGGVDTLALSYLGVMNDLSGSTVDPTCTGLLEDLANLGNTNDHWSGPTAWGDGFSSSELEKGLYTSKSEVNADDNEPVVYS